MGETAVLSVLPRGRGGRNWTKAVCRGGPRRWALLSPLLAGALRRLSDLLSRWFLPACALRGSPRITPGSTPAWGPHVLLGSVSLCPATEEVQITSKRFFLTLPTDGAVLPWPLTFPTPTCMSPQPHALSRAFWSPSTSLSEREGPSIFPPWSGHTAQRQSLFIP